MRKFLLVFLVIAVVASFGVALADRPTDEEKAAQGKPTNPPCDADHGHPLENLTRKGKDCPPGQGPKCPPSQSPNCPSPSPSPSPTDSGSPSPSPSPSPTGGPTCDDPDGDGTNHSEFNPEGDEVGPISSVVHEIDQQLPSPLGGDGGVVTEINCALVVAVEEALGLQ